jgi:Beta-glucan synthesis-associated protein SKN1/KRE6/Sbg1
VNLGFSPNFGAIDFEHLVMPTTMSVDYIRVYQPKDAHNIGCDPPNFPTAAYIAACVQSVIICVRGEIDQLQPTATVKLTQMLT